MVLSLHLSVSVLFPIEETLALSKALSWSLPEFGVLLLKTSVITHFSQSRLTEAYPPPQAVLGEPRATWCLQLGVVTDTTPLLTTPDLLCAELCQVTWVGGWTPLRKLSPLNTTCDICQVTRSCCSKTTLWIWFSVPVRKCRDLAAHKAQVRTPLEPIQDGKMHLKLLTDWGWDGEKVLFQN